MKKTLRSILILFILTLAILMIVYRKTVYYGYVQAKGQMGIIFHTVPVSSVLNDPNFPDSLKARIREISDVRIFARKKLGLTVKKNYTTYYRQKSENLMWVVTACKPFKLEAYEWHFPIIGSFSYKGFFDRSMAKVEEAKLKAREYDTSIRTAGGWSTLGILKDPILSGMLEEDEAGLAGLIIHELTHATIFLHDSVEFNENLATFISAYGTLLYLKDKYGESSERYRKYSALMDDREKYTRYILHSCALLDSLYKGFSPSESLQRKDSLKQELIGNIVQNLDTVSFSVRYRGRDFFPDGLPNNTYFMSFLRYHGLQPVFREQFFKQFSGNLPSYIQYLKKKYGGKD